MKEAYKDYQDGYQNRLGTAFWQKNTFHGQQLHIWGEENRAREAAAAAPAAPVQSPFGNIRNATEAEIIAHGLLRVMAENNGRHEEAALRTRAIELLCLKDKWGRRGREAREELKTIRDKLVPYDQERLRGSQDMSSTSGFVQLFLILEAVALQYFILNILAAKYASVATICADYFNFVEKLTGVYDHQVLLWGGGVFWVIVYYALCWWSRIINWIFCALWVVGILIVFFPQNLTPENYLVFLVLCFVCWIVIEAHRATAQ